jgi:hypothetical protein
MSTPRNVMPLGPTRLELFGCAASVSTQNWLAKSNG